MMKRQSFWQDKRVFVTGHTGFKGSWLAIWLQNLGATVGGYALAPPTDPSLFEMARIGTGMDSITGDVRDLAHLQQAMSEFQPDIVFHLAAQSLVRYSYEDPVETFTTNVIGTVNMLESVRHTESVRVVVSITSDKCYDNREWFWGYRENDRLGGHDPYSGSKACAEQVIATYRNSYFPPEGYEQHGVALASTRAGNVIGGGDWATDRLVPDIMKAVMERKQVLIRSPQATRPWQHVLEPLNGYLTLAEQLWVNGPQLAQPWNFGPNDEDAKPVSWIVDYLTSLPGGGPGWELDGMEQPHENTFLKLDCSKARNVLSWAPKLSLPTALEWIMEWFHAYQQDEDMRKFTEQQIAQFEAMAPGS